MSIPKKGIGQEVMAFLRSLTVTSVQNFIYHDNNVRVDHNLHLTKNQDDIILCTIR